MGQISGGSGNGDFGGETSGAPAGPSPWMKLLAGGAKGALGGFQNQMQQNQAMRPNAGPVQPMAMGQSQGPIQAPTPTNFTAADGPGTGQQGTLMNPQQKRMPGGGGNAFSRNSFYGMQ